MKKLIILSIATLFIVGCTNNNPQAKVSEENIEIEKTSITTNNLKYQYFNNKRGNPEKYDILDLYRLTDDKISKLKIY